METDVFFWFLFIWIKNGIHINITYLGWFWKYFLVIFFKTISWFVVSQGDSFHTFLHLDFLSSFFWSSSTISTFRFRPFGVALPLSFFEVLTKCFGEVIHKLHWCASKKVFLINEILEIGNYFPYLSYTIQVQWEPKDTIKKKIDWEVFLRFSVYKAASWSKMII